MPLSSEYKGKGPEVMANMAKTYGSKKGEQVYYATMNKHPEFKASKSAVKKLAREK